MLKYFLTGSTVVHSMTLCAQLLSNPSFEGQPEWSKAPPFWYSCKEFSTPDTQPVPRHWNITSAPSEGDTYVLLVTRGAGGYDNDYTSEAIGTTLLKPLEKGHYYNFSIDVAKFEGAIFIGHFGDLLSYDNPADLLLWGGSERCDKKELLWRIGPVTSTPWQTLRDTLTVSSKIDYLMFEAEFPGEERHYGHVMIDNMILEELPEKPCAVTAPNIFTPNGDELNDTFKLSTEADVVSFRMSVYNRWGKEIFSTHEISSFWNGDDDHGNHLDGVFYYVVNMTCLIEGSGATMKGTVSVIR